MKSQKFKLGNIGLGKNCKLLYMLKKLCLTMAFMLHIELILLQITSSAIVIDKHLKNLCSTKYEYTEQIIRVFKRNMFFCLLCYSS